MLPATTDVRSHVSSALTTRAVEFAVAATLLLGSASLVATSLGDPELMALVAATGAVVTLLTIALLAVATGDGRPAPTATAPSV